MPNPKPVAKLTNKEFVYLFNKKLLPDIKEDPITSFIKSPAFLNFTPTFAQEVALKCIFGQPLNSANRNKIFIENSQTPGTFSLGEMSISETELFKAMTGNDYKYPLERVLNRINLICGRRAGKSTISAILAIYCAIKTNWKPYLSTTPSASVVVLSHSREFSEEVLDIIRNFFESSPILMRLVDKSRKFTQTTFNLRIPFLMDNGKVEYSRVTIKVGTASKKTTRGRAVCALLCDEISFWNLDERSAERDVDIIRAVRPALIQFGDEGLLIKLSSPGIKQGILYEEYLKRSELPKNYVIFKAPTWVWNTLLDPRELEKEYILDSQGFDSEYRANFVDSISSFISPEFVDLCVIKDKTLLEPAGPSEDVFYVGAIDAAFKGDRFTFCLLGITETRVKQYVMQVWEGTPVNPVKSFEVAAYIKNLCQNYGITRVYADQFAYQPLSEIFAKYGIALVERTFTNTFKRQIYFNLKSLIHNQKVDLLDHEIMLSEIKQLQVEQKPTGAIKIGHPPGGRDDCADALAIAAHIATSTTNKMQFSMGDWAGSSSLIPTDINGRAFVAPTPEMLADQFFQQEFTDNKELYDIDPKTGKLKKKKDDGGGRDGGFNFTF